jgi:cytochrome c6
MRISRLHAFHVAAAAVGALALSVAPARAQNPPETLFKTKCAMCHAADGSGKTAMGEKLKVRDLRSDEVQKQKDAELGQSITKGKNKMPAYEGKLSKEEVAKLVAYIRELGKKH